ncbi:MAG: hypothetical protein MJ156_01455 [Alphaproteobacteria bacterium]|nr:hypothetical protein [Alphaproteobacteria bacterium]
MADKKYPLDITIACSIGLEGGLARFKNDLPNFSKDDFELVHEWNCCLRNTMKTPEFKEYITTKYRVLLHLPAVTLSKIIDKIAVPYRSYHYAKRFLDAAHFVYEHADQNVNIIDFGRGLSPWGHVVKQKRPDVQMFSFDKEETNLVFSAVSEKLNLPTPHFNVMPLEPKFNKDIFVSLGTFVYLDTAEQAAKIKETATKFKRLFIELDKPNAVQQDKELVNSLGTEYNAGFSRQELAKMLDKQFPFELKEIGGHVKDVRIAKALKFASEQFLVRQ